MKRTDEFPLGWNEQRVREVLDYYESQSDEEAAAEQEAALSRPDQVVMEVPIDLVPIFRQIIAEHEKERTSR